MAQFTGTGAARRQDQPPDRASEVPRFEGITFKPVYVRDPASSKPAAEALVAGDRRNPSVRKALTRRVCSEFEEMPGLALTLAQAVRLFGIPRDVCHRVLTQLVERGQLRRTFDGRFALRAGAN